MKKSGHLRTLTAGLGVFVFAALCCFTPLAVVALSAAGLSAWIGGLDYVLLPMLAVGAALSGFSAWRMAAAHWRLRAVLTCPECGARMRLTMPTNACQFFFDCLKCGALLRPKSGDCCVFCSYADRACPPKAEQAVCCGHNQ